MKIAAFILAVGLIVTVATRDMGKADGRAKLTRDWSGDDAQFVAVGFDNRTLLVVLPSQDNAACDAYIDDVVHDAKVSQELQLAGFETVQCSGRIEQLKGSR
jgi:hypothetical protein